MEELNLPAEPRPDIAHCSNCGWTGPAEDCPVETEGDWETGYYDIDLCPVCEDGGCVDDYSMSEVRAREWAKWVIEVEKAKGRVL